MPVKRELESPSPSASENDVPITPKKQNPIKKSSSTAGSETPSPSKKARATPATSSMSADIKERLVDHLMRVAWSAVQRNQLAADLGITKKQLDNAMCSGRTNLRSKLVSAAREM